MPTEGNQSELDVKRMLTSFDKEAHKFQLLAQKIAELNGKFQEKHRFFEGLKKAKEQGDNISPPTFKFINPNYSRWEDMQIHPDYRDAIYDLAIRQVIYEIQIIKKEIDYLIEAQKS
jgi:hypothetical protein